MNTRSIEDKLREEYPELRVYAFDYGLDLSAVQTLIRVLDIAKNLPAVVVHDTPYYGFKSLEDFDKILPELKKLRDALGNRPRWLAASTHAGEEAMAARVHRELKPRHAGLLTIIVPRHPDRGPEIAAALASDGLAVARRSSGDKVRPDTDIYVADTMGELGLFYRLACVAFMGKSLVPLGGQNPIEAARLGCAIVHGPHMMNFEDIAERLRTLNAARRVDDENALADTVAALLADGKERDRMAAAAEAFAVAEAGAVDAIIAELKPFIQPLAKGSRPRARA